MPKTKEKVSIDLTLRDLIAALILPEMVRQHNHLEYAERMSIEKSYYFADKLIQYGQDHPAVKP